MHVYSRFGDGIRVILIQSLFVMFIFQLMQRNGVDGGKKKISFQSLIEFMTGKSCA